MKASAKELRFHTREILEAVSRGEEVIITYRGKPRARIIPYDRVADENMKQDELFGIWKDNEKIEDVPRYVRDLRKGRYRAD